MAVSRQSLTAFLSRLADALSIPEGRQDQAISRYQSIGTWLGRPQSKVALWAPQVYPQGSIRLGTTIRPLSEDEEYDVDLVCELALSKSVVTQKALKALIGYEIAAYASAHGMANPPTEGKRCWTLTYADGAQFHLDILPALPDGERFWALLEARRLANTWARTAISITDNTHYLYDVITDDWLGSNPKGYAEWFKERMRPRLEEQMLTMAKAIRSSVETIPEHKIRTPLQRAIQILKRHRDIMFSADPEDKPISVIITTLAAQAYQNQPDLLDTLESITASMAGFVQHIGGEPTVSNPVNPLENFADKWRENPQKAENFARWVEKVREDLAEGLDATTAEGFEESQKVRYGNRAVGEAIQQARPDLPSRSTAILASKVVPAVLPNVPHRQPPRWPIVWKGNVEIEGWIIQDGFRPKRIKSNCGPIAKHCSLRFQARSNVPGPYKVYWQVVNTGSEATLARGLRGSFEEGMVTKGRLTKSESTLYHGMHWIECFIVRRGELVARSGEFIVNIA